MPTAAQDRLQRSFLSLRGLACGDCFGEAFFLPHADAHRAVTSRTLPPSPWRYTDDTAMAVSVLNVLRAHGEILPEALARSFVALYESDRGYGPAMHAHLLRLGVIGVQHWQREAEALFDGRGSMGNGASMRVAPLGAFFADDLDLLIEQARLSALTTHSHPDAAAGAIAVALAAALSWNSRDQSAVAPAVRLEQIAASTPPGPVRDGIHHAASLPRTLSAVEAARHLGNGTRATTADTVPFALWCAATWPEVYEQALWHTVSALGDRDTTCAIVGGIVVLRTGETGLPHEWLARAEPPWSLLV